MRVLLEKYVEQWLSEGERFAIGFVKYGEKLECKEVWASWRLELNRGPPSKCVLKMRDELNWLDIVR